MEPSEGEAASDHSTGLATFDDDPKSSTHGKCRVTCKNETGKVHSTYVENNNACIDFAISECGKGNFRTVYNDPNTISSQSIVPRANTFPGQAR